MIYWCARQWDVSKYVLSMNAADQYSANNAVCGERRCRRRGRVGLQCVLFRFWCALCSVAGVRGNIGKGMDRVRVKV